MQRFGPLIFNEKKQKFHSKNARCNMGMDIIYIMLHVSLSIATESEKRCFWEFTDPGSQYWIVLPTLKSFRYTDNLQFEGAFAE